MSRDWKKRKHWDFGDGIFRLSLLSVMRKFYSSIWSLEPLHYVNTGGHLWHQYGPMIGPHWSCDLKTGLWLDVHLAFDIQRAQSPHSVITKTPEPELSGCFVSDTFAQNAITDMIRNFQRQTKIKCLNIYIFTLEVKSKCLFERTFSI